MKRDNLLVRNEVIGFRGGLGKKTFTTVVFHLGTNQNVVTCFLGDRQPRPSPEHSKKELSI